MIATRSPLWRPIAAAAGAAMAVAVLGGLMTDIGNWYHDLAKPSWQPPDWLFGPVWTVIYALAATAGVLAWRATSKRETREVILGAFALNGFLNVLWSGLFFRLHHPDWALLEVGVFWMSIAILMFVLFQVSQAAMWLLAPYLGWVAFAGVLNLAVVRLNNFAVGL